ncbi:transcription-silencing protein Clr2-domain-containing protein [Achaetomium macrosporum]|uniref:Transcription-silencing protein Clr2-domain-containing protein n=1 Tax=Achaetomium macrosporum TaxID=79813 RepID=A0AAN7HAJ0_9PEZI|nr:transcription-silencing protein Clr2-domain-containing protein [Achaetomium macrosporum]
MASSASQSDEYWPIYIARSDGQGYPNLDYNALSPDDDKDVAQLERWEVSGAEQIGRQLKPKDDKRQYKLASFPKGYELRCAVRSEGGRDYYVYGHPLGPKAMYRTPGDFAWHCLWLASDSTDNSACTCELCKRYVEKVGAGRGKGRDAQATQLTTSTTSSGTASTNQAPATAPRPAPSQQPAQQQQTSPPGTTSLTNVFRMGELVWYKHTAWRLGVIMAIIPKPGLPVRPGAPDSSYHFTLAPLGHALLEQTTLVKDCQSMRPFLTFSVPSTGFDELKDKTFDRVNWQALTARYSQEADPNQRDMNRQVLGLEASKMGARAINDAFSTFDLLAQGSTPDGALHVQHYGGVYLGAEMVRVGDPIRVANPAQQSSPDHTSLAVPADANLVMHINEIQVLTPTTATTTAPVGGARATLRFKGNLYRTVRFSMTQGLPQNAVPAEQLGAAFVEELATRNTIEKDKTMRWTWVLVAAQVVRAEQDVLGRFYVTEKLMSVIDPVRFQTWVQQGLLEEAPAYLNNRSHSGGGAYAGRKAGRKAMFGEAVGVEFRAPMGMVEN